MHDQSYTDNDLFRLIAEGDETAFRLFFHRYVPELRPLIMHITKNAAVAEDIIQETFLRLWLSRDKLDTIENPRSWLLRIVFYQSFSYLRRQAVHTKAMDVIALRQATHEMRNTTEEALAYAQLTRLVGEVVRQLPPQARRIYLLSREKGLRIPEIARELALSPHTVKNSLVRSLQTIRKRIEQSGHFFPLLVLWLLKP
ncbi:RNA polymerase sigma factor [Chitinophaga japonensis]|uniref:RNA polymerase sigma-70 factor (ECF subfamily) n=1 Tax=Chitinophaga japonensis TaxID=104662 RepID=A0A562TD33_CHIJA|nr:RNA polymerase sigma-70 factor [Chitinophaga japonensis]TWI91164.1 RNA polymerase sigma-70 factor (ECF subfamily) [Chitinophaga japonensis]